MKQTPTKRLPITVPAPAERPRCHGCARLLRPDFHTIYVQETTPTGTVSKPIERRFEGWLGPGLGFCTYRCALSFASAAHTAGYRWRPR